MRNKLEIPELRKYIVTILYDIRGDNEYPSEQVLQANASLLYTRILSLIQKRDEKIREKVDLQRGHASRLKKERVRRKSMQGDLIKAIVWQEAYDDAIDDVLAILDEQAEEKTE
jgi:hypothetical protein